MSYLPAFLIVIALLTSYLLGYTPLFISAIFIVLSLITFLTYAKDKSAAENDTWRVPENTLHILSLLSGWPGAIIAQQAFRHKTKKNSFRISLWITVVANCGVLAWLHTRQGAIYLNTCTFALEKIILNEMSSGNARAILLTLLSFHA